jgi:hypothetical protein
VAVRDEAIEHVDKTNHKVEWNEEHELWACLECSWVDSNFIPIVSNLE